MRKMALRLIIVIAVLSVIIPQGLDGHWLPSGHKKLLSRSRRAAPMGSHSSGQRQHFSSFSRSGRAPDYYSASNHHQRSPSGQSHLHFGDGCANCDTLMAKRQSRLDSIKMDILNKLGMSSPPNITRKRLPNIPQIRQLLEKDYQQNDSPFDHVHNRLKTTKVINFPQPAPAEVRLPDHVYYFRIQSEVHHSQVKNATFGIYVRCRNINAGRNFRTPITLHVVGPPKFHDEQNSIEFYSRADLEPCVNQAEQWVNFDVRKAVQNWVSRRQMNYGFYVSFGSGMDDYEVVEPRPGSDSEQFTPFLDIDLSDNNQMRSRRSLPEDCDEGSAQKHCCRYPLVVSFEEFRWDWIIAPKSYSAYYCAGECPFTFRQTHAQGHLVQQGVTNRGNSLCCSPRDMSPISIIYFDSFMNIITGVLPGMVANSCGCA